MKFNESFDKYMSLYNEAKEAPKGKHYDKAGRLQSGDADSDGRGGPKFRSDPTYKNPNEDEEGREFFFGYDIENVHPVEEFVKANYKEGEYGVSVGHGDDVMNYLKVNVDLDDERGKKLLDMIEDCDGEGNFDEDDYFEDEEGKKKGLDGKACWDGYELRGTKKKGGKTVDNCVKSSDEESSEDNETAKKIGKGALKLAGKAALGTAKLAGKGAREVAHFATDDVYRSKKEDCETCGCEENPEYGHLDDTYSKYIDQYEPKEDCETCGCEDAEAGCECGNCPDCTPKEDNEYDMGEVLDGIAADFANDMTKSELEAKYGTDAVAKFIKYGDEDGLTASEDAEKKIDKDRMKCNSPRRTSGGSKKFVVKACKDGKEKIVRFGDPNMKIKKSNPKRRKSFRARHKCDQKKDKFSAGYWSCKKW